MAIVLGQGGGGNIQSNSNTVTSSITMTNGNNYSCIGPITINSGVTVTVNSGSVWKIQ